MSDTNFIPKYFSYRIQYEKKYFGTKGNCKISFHVDPLVGSWNLKFYKTMRGKDLIFGDIPYNSKEWSKYIYWFNKMNDRFGGFNTELNLINTLHISKNIAFRYNAHLSMLEIVIKYDDQLTITSITLNSEQKHCFLQFLENLHKHIFECFFS